MYPEALIASKSILFKFLGSFFIPFAWFCYQFCDVFADIGNCMRNRLLKYRKNAICETLTPWALKEPLFIPDRDPVVRKELFGDAKIGLLYSGTVGHAHNLQPFINLARLCRKNGIDAAFCFAGYGNCYKEQTSVITKEDTNIRLAGFTSEENLEKRLAAADIHMVSLREGWEGVVVPSKFFGSLAIGRPVIFSGPQNCCISEWCHKYNFGFLLDDKTPSRLANTEKNPEEYKALSENAYNTYQKYFSKRVVCDNWVRLFSESIFFQQDIRPLNGK